MSAYNKAAYAATRNAMTAELLRQRLSYDPQTGVFTWLETHVHRLGKEAGSTRTGVKAKGGSYRMINIGGALFRAHRLAWLYMTGEWPTTDVDHINGNRADNRWSNLRLASRAENNANAGLPKNNTSGVKGVSFDPKRKRPWRAMISKDNRSRLLGDFSTKEEAATAYQQAAMEQFGEFARLD